MQSEKLKLIFTTNIVTEHDHTVSWLSSICMLLRGGAGWMAPMDVSSYELPNAALPCAGYRGA